LCGKFINDALESRRFSRAFSDLHMGCAAPPCQDGMVARGQTSPYIPRTFQSSPMIWCFARKAGEAEEEIRHGHRRTLDAEGDRRLAVG
jgi:hypothetical protein